jgi:hypothetical protein
LYRQAGDTAKAAQTVEEGRATYIRVNEPVSRLPNSRQE